MKKRVPLILLCMSVCAASAESNRFSLVRSDSGDGSGSGNGVFSLDESTIRLSCAEEAPRRPAEGEPAIAVLCHGFAGRKESGLFDALSKSLRNRGIGVVRFDFNGHGESEGDFSRMTVSNEVLDVETVVDYCRNVRGARVALVGHSQGGVVAALAAARLGADSVEALALLAPAAVLREDAQRGRIFDAVFDPLDPPAAIPVMEGRLLLGRDYVLDAQQTDPYAAIAAYGGPLVVVHGQGDTVVPWSCGQRFVDAHPGQGDLVLLRSADHVFTRWEDTVADVVADFLAKSFGHAEVSPVPEVAAPAEETHAESAEAAEPGPAVAVPAEEIHAESAEPGSADAGEAGLESAAEEPPQQSIPVELPPDIRGDMQSFLHALDTQTAAEAPSEPVVAAPSEETHAESAEAPSEPVVAAPAEETHAEAAEVAEPVPAVAVPAEETYAESAEVAEPVPEVATPAEEIPAESAEIAEPVPEVAPPAEETHAESAEGGEAATPESMPAAEPPVVDSIQDLAAAYPSLPIAPNGSVINILAAPNGLTWQGLEIDEEDMIERLRIFGASIPDAYVRIQAFPETPFERVRALAVTAKEAGFSRISVVLPSAR